MLNLFCIRPQGFNVGNDAIFISLQCFLYQAFEQVVNLISLPATSRYESQAKAGLTAKTIYEINQYGHGVIVGGGNLYENGELDVSLDALETLEVPMMLFSLSSGRIYNRQHTLVSRTDAMPARIINPLNQKANYSLARDEQTYLYLKSIGCDRIQLGGCPTIFLNQIAQKLPNLFKRDQGQVLISVRNPSLMSIPLRKQSQVRNDILQIIDFLKNNGYKDIRFLCHDHRDISFAASFEEMEYVYTGDVYTYLAMLRSCALSISYRLHASLPCFSFGTPTIKISYDERAISLMNTIGLGEWNINMMESEHVVGEVIKRHQRLKELPNLISQNQVQWNQLHETMTKTFRLFAQDVLEYSKKNI